MRYRPFGNNGFDVSEIGFGANTISGRGTYGYVDEADGVAAVRRARELGITLFDTAEGYSEGRSEEVLGKVLGNDPNVVVCTKVGGYAGPIEGPARIRRSAEQSLRRLRRDAIDIYLLHNPPDDQIASAELQAELTRLKDEGKVRAFGVSVPHRDEPRLLSLVVAHPAYTAVELSLNLLDQANVPVLPRLRQAGLGVIARMPLASGLLGGKYGPGATFPPGDARDGSLLKADQIARDLAKMPELQRRAEADGLSLVHAALAWVLGHAAVSSAVAGAKRPWQVESNAAASGIALSEAFRRHAATLA
ncbi:MAG: aldo/keto reductase [SAR202 cluster bacterium]|nr:aldo/keto reductase [SAR202 cluster bacterium]